MRATAAREIGAATLEGLLARLRAAVASHDAPAVLAALAALAPEYRAAAPAQIGESGAQPRLRIVKG